MNTDSHRGLWRLEPFFNVVQLFWLITLAVLFPAVFASAQSLPTLDFTGKPGEKRPELLDSTKPSPTPALTLPAPSLPRKKDPASSIVKGLFVRKIIVTGSTAFAREEISKITSPYENRKLTMEDLESLRRELTLLYVNKGYINSGAIIPDQTVSDGQLAFLIVEGRLTRITIDGNRWFRENTLRRWIARGTDTPVNILPLQERLQLLQQDQRIERIHAELRPGAKPGEGELTVRVAEKPPFSAWLGFNNYQSPAIGADRGLVTLAHQNLTGHGDILDFTYGYSKGLNPLIDTKYALPLNAYDTTLILRYRNNNATVVDKVFGPLDIVSKSETFEMTLRQPVYRTLSQEFALSLTAEREESRTSLLGEQFSFSPGMDNGRAVVAPLRFSQEWTCRTRQQVIAARSRLTFGLNSWDATIHGEDTLPDGDFFAWLGQLQWARVLGFLDTQLIARADLQFSNDPLLPVEQIAVGGRYSVRGYRESLMVRDQAFIASVESRIPLIQNKRWADYLQLAPFLDYGRGANVDAPTESPLDISSIGLGLRWGASADKAPFLPLLAEAEIYYGHQLRRVDTSHEDIQDDGVHFQFAISAHF